MGERLQARQALNKKYFPPSTSYLKRKEDNPKRKEDSRIVIIKNRLNCYKLSTGKARTSYCHLKVPLRSILTHSFVIVHCLISLLLQVNFRNFTNCFDSDIVLFRVTAAARIQRESKGDQFLNKSSQALHYYMLVWGSTYCQVKSYSHLHTTNIV